MDTLLHREESGGPQNVLKHSASQAGVAMEPPGEPEKIQMIWPRSWDLGPVGVAWSPESASSQAPR